MSFVEVLDIRTIDELAKAQLLWYVDPPYVDDDADPRPYAYSGRETDLPSVFDRTEANKEWRYYILVEE